MIIAGTGHRPDKLGGYSEKVFNTLKDTASFWLMDNMHKVDKVISGMALGWDQALAEAALELHIHVLAAVPFKNQEAKWSKESQYKYRSMLDKCSVVIVSPGVYIPFKMQIRNEWMVDQSDMILALWNGTEGGTANCIKYAKEHNKPIINLWDEFK